MSDIENQEPGEITQLLLRTRDGDKAAEQELIQQVYAELRKIAASYLRHERSDHILQPTALVHEAYLRFADLNRLRWQDRTHFFGVAARLMRNILVDDARKRKSSKYGGNVKILPISGLVGIAGRDGHPIDVLALNEALDRLGQQDARMVRVVELRYFVGLTIDETADALRISPRTVRREWSIGRAWLQKELGSSGGPENLEKKSRGASPAGE